MNLTERAEIRKETFYKLTNSRDIPERLESSNVNLYIESKSSPGYISAHSESLGGPTKDSERTSDFISVSKNEKYVFQGWVTVPADGYPWHRYQFYGADKHPIGEIYRFESNNPLTGKQHYAEHITVPSDENIAYIRISARLFDDGKVKFEKGDVATPYSQAPEDLGWSTSSLVPTQTNRYLWKLEYVHYSDGSVDVIAPVNLSIAGADIDSKELEAFKKDLANVKGSVSEVKATTEGIVANVASLDNTTVKKATLNLDNNGFVTQVGKVVDGKTFATMISQNPENVKIIANKMQVSADMIVDGAITSTKIAAGAITADKIKAGSITTDMFKANKITSLNGATTFDLASGDIIFNNMRSGTIQQKNGNYKSLIDMFSLEAENNIFGDWSSIHAVALNGDSLTTSTKCAGMRAEMYPNSSELILNGERIYLCSDNRNACGLGIANQITIDSNTTTVGDVNKNTTNSKGNWDYQMIMNFGSKAALRVSDVRIAGYTYSLEKILRLLCQKAGILWM